MRFKRLSLSKIFNGIFGWPVAIATNQPAAPLPPQAEQLNIAPLRLPISIGDVPAALQCWNSRFRFPLTRPRNANEQRAYDAIQFNLPLTFTYCGSDGTTQRTAHPIFIFHVEGFPGAYVTAYCQLRQEIRIFHLDRMYFSAV